MSRLIRVITPGLAVLLLTCPVAAATPQEIMAAIAKGKSYLKNQQQAGAGTEIGIPALVGLALLETGVPFDDPVLKTIAAEIREGSFSVTATYHVALALLFLDRYGDPNDVPLVQMLGIRVLLGQTNLGGWGYSCTESVPNTDIQFLRARLKPGAGGQNLEPGKLHPDVAQYHKALAGRPRQVGTADDNSNTQFGLLALWASRKHGVPADAALDLVVERFIRTQNPNTGGWAYTATETNDGTASMTCAGLLGLSTGYARREERLQKLAEKDKKPEPGPSDQPKSNDPFFSPPNKAPVKGPARPAPDRLDFAAARGMANLGAALVRSVQAGRGRLLHDTMTLGQADLYFFWSVERVGVIYGLDKIGGVDWYEAGAETIVRLQRADGSWPDSGGGNAQVSTAFSLLFLSKSNVVRDLSQKVQKTEVELRGGAGPGEAKVAPGESKEPGANVPNPAVEAKPKLALPIPVETEYGRMALDLVQATPLEWNKKLQKLRDAKGSDNTMALAIAIPRLEGDRKKDAREALAERLTRMTPDTLRRFMKSEDPELRRGAVLAAAMTDDKAYIVDLIDCLMDEDELVVRAARAGLKSLSGGKDFGPQPGASRLDREAAVKNWRQWWATQKK